jgi:hypothetical protein
MHDDVGAVFKRTLQDRRAEAIVDRQQRAGGMRDVGDGGDIDQFGQRVGRRFDEEQARARTHRRAIGRQIGGRHERGFDAELGQDVAEQLLRGAEQAARSDHMITGLQHSHRQRQDGRHAGRRGDAGFSPFEGSQARLQGGDGGIGEARIDVAFGRAGKTGRGFGGTAEHIAGGEVQRFRMFAELAALDARAYGERIEIEFFHVNAFQKAKNPFTA